MSGVISCLLATETCVLSEQLPGILDSKTEGILIFWLKREKRTDSDGVIVLYCQDDAIGINNRCKFVQMSHLMLISTMEGVSISASA